MESTELPRLFFQVSEMVFTFKMTPEAIEAVRKILKGIPEIEHPILAPIYDQRDVTRSKLALGIYEKKNLVVENSLLMKLYEFEFYIDPSMADALFEQTLAYVDGSFIVI